MQYIRVNLLIFTLLLRITSVNAQKKQVFNLNETQLIKDSFIGLNDNILNSNDSLNQLKALYKLAKPTEVDTYLQTKYFPEITDPTLLEIRRERGIELCLEGFRFDDIVRWKRGELMQMEWNGMYVPSLDTPLDLNEDGVLDVAFYKKLPTKVAGVTYVEVSPTIAGKPNSQLISGETSGELTWLNNISRKWSDKQYYYPIPAGDIITNPNLKQNAGW